MPDVVVDTASVIQKERAPDWVIRHVVGARVWLTFVTVAELWKWAEVRSWGEPNRERLDAWINGRPVIPYDIARWWARPAAERSCGAGRGPRTTCGSRAVASYTACRCSPSTRWTSPTSQSTTGWYCSARTTDPSDGARRKS